MWRDPEKVREFSDESTKLSFAIRSNYFDPDDPKSDIRPYLNFDQAFNELQMEAAYRGLSATARNVKTGEFGRISEAIWPELEPNFTEQLVSLYVHKAVRAFDDIRFERAEVVLRWPELRPGKTNLPDLEISISDAINSLATNGKDLAGYQIDDTRLQKEACALLVDMLTDRECYATGTDQESGIRQAIEDEIWRAIATGSEKYKIYLRSEGSSESDVDTLMFPGETKPRWKDIRISFGAYSLPGQVRKATISAETECGKHLIALMENGSSPTQNKGEYEAEFKEKFAIGARAFKRQWDRAIEATGNVNWNKPGRKKSSS